MGYKITHKVLKSLRQFSNSAWNRAFANFCQALMSHCQLVIDHSFDRSEEKTIILSPYRHIELLLVHENVYTDFPMLVVLMDACLPPLSSGVRVFNCLCKRTFLNTNAFNKMVCCKRTKQVDCDSEDD